MLNIYHKNSKDKKLEHLENFKNDSWIYVEKPTIQELKYLHETFSLDKDLLHDSIDIDEVPRIEIEDGITYVFARYAYQSDSHVDTAPILLILGKNFVITISQIHFPQIDKLIKEHITFFTDQKVPLFLQFFALISSSYNYFLTQISRQIRSITINVEKIGNEDIVKFVNFEIILNDFLLALVRLNMILNRLLTDKTNKFNEDSKDLVEGFFIDNEQLIEICKENLRNMVNVREAYSTIMTNNLNRVIKLFTSLTVILTIPTIIASMYGMNVTLPFERNPMAFFLIVGFIVFTSLSLILIFMRNKWL